MGLYSHVSGYPVGFWVAGLVASIWGALLAEQYAEKQSWQIAQYETRLNGLNYALQMHQRKIDTLESQLVVAKVEQSKILKNQDVLAGQITDIDRRVQGNDPFGG